jgi:tRNA-modifying protein YgfZ
LQTDSEEIVDHPELNASAGPRAAAPRASFNAAYVAATSTIGVRLMRERKVVRVVGDDRVSFFHGMCSADIKGATVGSILPALFLTEHAHVIADLFIWVTDDALLLEIDAEAWRRAREHLERLLVADDVEFEDTSLTVIDVAGPRANDAAALIAGADVATLAAWRYLRVDESIVGNLPRLGAGAFTLLAPAAHADSIVERLLSDIPGAALIDDAVAETIRIENGIARVGVDTAEKTLALEARLDRAISFNKGCYLGQETIERATARGALKKKLCALKFPSGKIPAQGAALKLDGKEVGRVTSMTISPRAGAIGLAILHHSAWNPGTALSLDDEAGAAVVCEMPSQSNA